MSPAPALSGSFSESLYEYLAPLARRDEEFGYHLAHYIAAWGVPHQLVEDLVRDTDAGPGWSALLDIDRAPTEAVLPGALGFLGMLRGVSMLAQLATESDAEYDAAMRDRIRFPLGPRRGSPDAIQLAAERHLTGAKTVYFLERSGSAYHLTVTTLASETPDEPAVLAALLAQKPAGIAMTYSTIVGGDWETLRDTHTDWSDVEATFTDWDDVRSDPSQI